MHNSSQVQVNFCRWNSAIFAGARVTRMTETWVRAALHETRIPETRRCNSRRCTGHTQNATRCIIGTTFEGNLRDPAFGEPIRRPGLREVRDASGSRGDAPKSRAWTNLHESVERSDNIRTSCRLIPAPIGCKRLGRGCGADVSTMFVEGLTQPGRHARASNLAQLGIPPVYARGEPAPRNCHCAPSLE